MSRGAGLLAGVVVALGLALSGVGAAPATAADVYVRHLQLLGSTPAADAVVTESPAEIRTVFSEPPQPRGSSLRLTQGRRVIETTDTEVYAEDTRQLLLRPVGTLAPGTYTVHWRVIAQDGHTQRGTYDFRIAGE